MIIPKIFYLFPGIVGIGFLGALAPLGLEIGKKIGQEAGKQLFGKGKKEEKKPTPTPTPTPEKPFWQNPIFLVGAGLLTFFLFFKKK